MNSAFRRLAAMVLLGHAFLTNCQAESPPSQDTWNATLLTVKPDHANGLYAPNEPAVWTVDVTKGDRSALGAVPYAVKRDGGDAIATGTIDLSAGPATITATRAEPGALLAVVSVPAGKRPHPFTGGAIFAAEKIGPGAPAPADFDDFWKAQLQYLDSIPPNPVLEKGSVEDVKFSDGVPYYKVTLDNIWHTQVHGQLSRPVSGNKFPAILWFQSAGVGPLEKGMAVRFAKKGYLILNIEAHDIPIDETPAFYNNLKATTLKDYTSIGLGSRDTYYFLRMVLGCVRAAEYLTSRPDWDGKTLIVAGGSQGGFQSFATAALFPKVTAVVSDNTAGGDAYAAVAQPSRALSWPAMYFPPRPDDPDGSKTRTTLGYFDTIYFAGKVHCPALVCAGLIDETARPASVFSIYNAIPAANKELLVFPFYDHALAGSQLPYWHRLDDWTAAAKNGQPLPPQSTPAPDPNSILISGAIPPSNAASSPH